MTEKYCEICDKNISTKIFNIHRHKIKYIIDSIPDDLTNIICSYKNDLEIFEKYNRFIKFILFFNNIRSFETISVNYNCDYKYNINYYLDDMIYIMKNILPPFNFDIRQMITGKKLKEKNFNIKIFKFNIEYNIYNNKYYLRYL